jgi:hypothetical protein
MGLFFWFFSQFANYWCLEKPLIFVYWFSILLLCWKCLWCLRILWWCFWGLLGIRQYHVQIRIIYLFLSDLNTFYFFQLFIALSRNSKTILNKSGEGGYCCLLPDFTEKSGFRFFFFFHLVWWWLYVCGLCLYIMLSHVPSIPSFIRAFMLWNLQHCLFCSGLLYLFKIFFLFLYEP